MAVIEHVFVLMLENRSFDHMLGFAGLPGVDGLTGSELNVLSSGVRVPATAGADFTLPVDPGHEFEDVLEQLCGPGATYPAAGGAYPPIDNSGFAANAAAHLARTGASGDPSVVMRGFTAAQLPVLNALAREFALCDRWFSSIPGPTWPNRLFVHAASSAGLYRSPSSAQSAAALVDGYRFKNGTIYDRLEQKSLPWSIVEGDALPQSLAIGGMLEHAVEGRFVHHDEFIERLQDPAFDDAYVFIEPSYGHVLADGSNFKCGTSMHPLDDVTRGERFVKEVYEAIRGSSHWQDSLLIITFDENGGMYDHVPPPWASPPGDGTEHGFAFDQLGVRVPALVVSPYTERGAVDHTVYDHTSVLATVERLYGLEPLTKRDAAAASFEHLLARSTPRDDAPLRLPEPADSGLKDCAEETLEQQLAIDLAHVPQELSGALEPALVGFVHVALAREIHLAAAVDRDVDGAIAREKDRLLSTLDGLETKLDAVRLLRDVDLRYRRFRELVRAPR